jgi:hydrogenase maturation factor
VSNKKLVAVSLLLCSSLVFGVAMGQADYGSGAIKSPYGFLHVWNGTNNHYSLEIRGKNVRQIPAPNARFYVDGMFLQIVTAPISEFIKPENRKALDDKAILEAHRDWEHAFMENDYKEKLKLESSWQKLSNGKDALAWQIIVPESAHSNVKKQLSLTLMKGDFVLMLGGVSTETVSERDSQQLLIDTANTLKTSEEPIDLKPIQQSFREAAAALEGPIDRTKFGTMKGKIFRSDTKQPIPNAAIVLIDENKSEKSDNTVSVQADEQGNYSFTKVAAGTYTVSLRAWYKTQEEAPCQFLMAKTAEKNSQVMVAKDGDRFVQQVFIRGFAVKAGKDVAKDFDFACKSMFGN